MSDPISLCVLADPYLRQWQVQAIKNAVINGDCDVEFVIVEESENLEIDHETAAKAVNEPIGINTFKLFIDLWRQERFWTLVLADRKLSEQFFSASKLDDRVAVDEISCFQTATVRQVEPISDGDWNQLPTKTVEKVASSCDLVVRFGFGLLRGEILTAPKWGVVSFHPADIRRYRGLGPPQVYLDGQETIGVTLQRLNEEIDGGEIIADAETQIATTDTLWDVYRRVQELQMDLLTKGIANLRDPAFEPTVPPELGAYYSTDSRRRLSFAGRILLKNAVRRIR